MKKNEFENNKTEFLFESDAEKVVLKQAVDRINKKNYRKKITINTIVISFFIIGISCALKYYQINQINNIKAAASQVSFTKINEKMNKSSDKLEFINNNYDDKYSVLVNKANPINKNLISNYTLTKVENNMYNNIKLEKETYKNYLKLKKNLLNRGYYINIKCGFKTIKETYFLYKQNNKAISEHNTGLAFDIVITNNKNSYKTNYKSDEYIYLENIAYLYGFIIRYPKGKEKITGYDYEPSHLRYVGTKLAKYLKKNNLTLEEYYE